MQNEEGDLRERTKEFALRIIRMFGALPKKTEAQILGKQVYAPGRLLARIIVKRLELAAEPSLYLNVAIRYANSKNPRTGWSYSLTLK